MGASHTIVSCFVFDEAGKLLLLRRHRDDYGGGLWATPAGSIDEGESPEEAIIREIQEETGLIVASVEYLGRHHITMPHGSVQMASYKTHLVRPGQISLRADEHEDYRWFMPATLLDEADIIWGTPSILRDFGLLADFETDPTLTDGSTVVLL